MKLKRKTIWKTIKWSVISLTSVILLITAFGFWFVSLLPVFDQEALKSTTPEKLPYLMTDVVSPRGKILAVVTSTDTMGNSNKPTGYELTELSRAYYVFVANGFEVDIASPQGGQPPVVIDDEDMGVYDYAFLNDSIAQYKTQNTISMDEVLPEVYDAIYFVGGKGAMFDFPQNPYIQSIVRDYFNSGKVIGAVCHGPAALVNVTLEDNIPLLVNRTVTSFTNEEETFLIPEAENIFPFLLQTKLESKGARFSEGITYLENVCQDGNLVTGQNPWSTWTLAETMVSQLGYPVKQRDKTAEENSIRVLSVYETNGYKSAKEKMHEVYEKEPEKMERTLLAMHGIVAVMQLDMGKAFNLIRLLANAKTLSENYN